MTILILTKRCPGSLSERSTDIATIEKPCHGERSEASHCFGNATQCDASYRQHDMEGALWDNADCTDTA